MRPAAGRVSPRDYSDTPNADKVKLSRFITRLHDRGIRVIGRGLWYISAAHIEEDIESATAAATEVLNEMEN